MKFQSTTRWGAVATAALFFLAASAQAKLKPGDPAPKLQVAKWVQGEPVKELALGQAYIVEFWATWCGPCRESIPHLNALHQKFKDKGFTVIGQNVFERDETLVEPFVKSMGDKMTYRVALDDKSGAKGETKGAMAVNWMEAAGQEGIPAAFVIDKKGVIAWIGHPMELTEKLLDDVAAGRFDTAKAAAESATREKNEAELTKLSGELEKALESRSWDAAETAAGKMEQLLPESDRDQIGMARFEIQLGRKDYAAAWKLASGLADAHQDNPALQNQLAWVIVARDGLEKRDLALAEKLAERASKASEGKDASVLDTLARAQFMNGKKSEAVESESRAVGLVDGPEKEALRKTLEIYRAGKLPEVIER